MCLSLKISTSSHGTMGIRAHPALKMSCLWLVSDELSFVCQGLLNEEGLISWKHWNQIIKEGFDPLLGWRLEGS